MGSEVRADEAINEEAMNEEATNEEALNEEATNEEALNEEATNEEAMNEEATNEEALSEEATNEEALNEEWEDWSLICKEGEEESKDVAGPATPEKNGEHNLASSSSSRPCAYNKTPKHMVFDSFAPASDRFLLAPYHMKYKRQTHNHVVRRLDFTEDSSDNVMELETSNCSCSGKEEEKELQHLFEIVYGFIMDAILAEQQQNKETPEMAEVQQQGNEKPEMAEEVQQQQQGNETPEMAEEVQQQQQGNETPEMAEEVQQQQQQQGNETPEMAEVQQQQGTETPEAAPFLNGIVDTCPAPPIKSGRNRRFINEEIRKKLDYF